MGAPAAITKTINDLVPDVIDALQGRTDVASIAPRYIRRALMEITESQPFEELRKTGPTAQLTMGQATYPAATFISPGDDYTSPEAFVLYIDYPTNQVALDLKYRTPKAIQMMIAPAVMGPPSRWTRFGVNISVGPVPDKPYYVYMLYQVRHPFPPDPTALGGGAVMVPDSWEEIVTYSAAERIAVVKRWNDQAKFLHDILYGDPEYQASDGKKGRPGLIAARTFQVERDQKFDTRQLMPCVPRYSPR